MAPPPLDVEESPRSAATVVDLVDVRGHQGTRLWSGRE